MNVKEALARREELHAQHERVQTTIDEHAAARRRIAQQEDPHSLRSGGGSPRPRATEKALAQARVDAARGVGGAAAEVEHLEQERDRIVRDAAGHLDAIRVAQQAKKQVADDLAQLHRDEFEAFAEHASGFTEAANTALTALRPAYEKAVEAWEDARRAWAPVARDNGFQGAPRCPLPPPADVFEPTSVRQRSPGSGHAVERANVTVARPPEIELTGEAA